MSGCHRPLILFGRHSSSSEKVALKLQEKLLKVNIAPRSLSLNDSAGVTLAGSNHECVVVVCATEEAGDVVDNADSFLRLIKSKPTPDTCSGFLYCVFAFEDVDSVIDDHFGKIIDDRMREMGGTSLVDFQYSRYDADFLNATEAWCSDVIISLDRAVTRNTISCDEVLSRKECDVKLTRNGVTSETSKSSDTSVLLPGTATISNVCTVLSIPSCTLACPPDPSLLPRSRKPAVGSIEVLWDDDSEMTDGFNLREDGEYSLSQPYEAVVVGANWLTKHDNEARIPIDEEWGEHHDVIRMELDIRDSGILYQPGDYISVVAPNPQCYVDLIIERLQKGLAMNKSLVSSTLKHVQLSAKSKILRNGEILNLLELLQFRLDLVTPPRKPCIFSLSDYCLDESESSAMKWICSKGEVGKKLWNAFIESQSLGIAEVLALFPSCCPPLHVLVSFLSPLAPRPYSVASSPLAHPNSVVLAFSIVRYCCGLSSAQVCPSEIDREGLKNFCIKRSGLCTSYLEKKLQPLLQVGNGEMAERISLRVIWKPSISFRLPGNVASPLILIGPGTGVAPFIGFLEHRYVHDRERSQSGEDTTTGLWRGGFELNESCGLPCEGNAIDNFIQLVDPGPMLLFYGCRNEKDWLFKESMLRFAEDGTLFSLDVAFSRETAKKVYVSHKILAKGSELVPLIMSCNAYIYICGDGKQMAKDVMEALAKVLHEHGDLSEENALEFLDEMKSRRRILMDVWS